MGIDTLCKHRVATMVADKLKRFNHNDVKAIHEGVTTGILKNNTAWEETGLQPGWSNHNVLTLLYPKNIVTNVQGHFNLRGGLDHNMVYKPWEHLSVSHYKYSWISLLSNYNALTVLPEQYEKSLQGHFNLEGTTIIWQHSQNICEGVHTSKKLQDLDGSSWLPPRYSVVAICRIMLYCKMLWWAACPTLGCVAQAG